MLALFWEGAEGRMFFHRALALHIISPLRALEGRSLPVVLRPVYSGDGLLTGEEGGGTSTDVADFAGENDGMALSRSNKAKSQNIKILSHPDCKHCC